MLVLIRVLGIFMVAAGVVFLVNQKAIKQYMAFWQQGKRLRVGGIINIVLSICLFLAASQCKASWVVTAIAIMSLLKGLVILILPLEKTLAQISWWANRSSLASRFLGIVAIGIGVLVLYSI